MHKYLLFLFILLTSQAFGQFTYSPKPLTMSITSDAQDNSLHFTTTNPKDSAYTVFWKVEKDSSTWNPAWETMVCDKNTCYLANLDMCPASIPNYVGPQGNLAFEFHLNPKGQAGATVLVFRLFGDKEFKNEIMKTKIYVNSPVSTKNTPWNSSISVYPNPAIDYFSLTNNQSVKKIVLYNMFGKEVKTFFHYNNAEHEISELKAGMYIVKMFDDKNKVVKTTKLNKVYGGA